MIIQIAKNQADYFGLMRLRSEVFVQEQHVSPSIELDQKDDDALHVVAILNNQVVGCCRIIRNSDSSHTIGRLAVKKELRHQKIATSLLEYIETIEEVKEGKNIILHAQIHAYQFYINMGYTPYGNHFYEAGIEHVEMRKSI